MNWKVVNRNGMTYAFKDVVTIHQEEILVRIGVDGVMLFGKNERANAAYFHPGCFASSGDFQGTNGDGFLPILCGGKRADGSLWFSDGIYECLAPWEYDDIKKVVV